MNLIYLLTNKNKKNGRRFYIGSKQESTIQEIDGIGRVIDKKGIIYSSFSQSIEFRKDLKGGDIFEATLLEEVADKKELIRREEYWIQFYNAVFSDDYYNITNAVLNCHDQEVIINQFGQTLKEVAGDRSSVSKKDNTALKFGFDNFGVLIFSLYDEYLNYKNWRRVSREFSGMPHYYPRRTVIPFNMVKANKELKNDLTKEVRMLYIKGATLQYIAGLLKIELPTARVFLGEYNGKFLRSFLTSVNLGMSRRELEVAITKEFISGKGVQEIARIF